MTLGNNLQIVDYVYNARGWLKSINDVESPPDSASDSRFSEKLDYYQGDSYNGNVMEQSLLIQDTVTSYQYSYDDLDRLVDVDTVSGETWSDNEAFAYDLNGNRLSWVPPWSSLDIDYTYTSGGNQLVSLTGYATNSYTYDPSGNIASDSVKKASFYYDIYGQLNMITFPRHGFDAGDSILYGYSNSGQRVYKIFINNYTDICGGGTPRGGGDFGTRDIEPPPIPCPYRDTTVTVYVRGKDGKVLAECGQQWAVPRAKYVYAGDQRIAMYNSSG